MSWDMVSLGEISEFIRNGASIKQLEGASGLPITRIETIADRVVNFEKCGYADVQCNQYMDRRLRNGDILISHINSEKHLGKCAIFESNRTDIIHGMNLLCFRPKENIHPKYVFYYLSCSHFLSQLPKITKKSVNQASFTVTHFKELTIPLPPLPIQKQIAAILEKADTLRSQCQQMEQELNSLAQSVFLDMFGEPAEYVGKKVKLQDCLETIESGWSPKCKTTPASEGKSGVLKLGAVTTGVYKEIENKELLEGIEAKSKIEVKVGDLLFTRKNTLDLVAAVAFVRETRRFNYLSDLIFRFVVKEDFPVSKVFLWGLFSSGNFRKQIQSLATGAAASMSNISKAKLLNVDIPLPPLELQEKYRDFVVSLWEFNDVEKKKRGQVDELFNALMQRAFKGELNLKLPE